jgi:hypothetical protein
MDQTTFVRKVGGSLDHFAWFLGAGASQSAGLPTAVDIIWELKTRYFCTAENQIVQTHDAQNPAVREKINAFVESRGLPVPGSAEEYSKYFELSFGDDKEAQRQFLRDALSDDKGSLAIGYRVLAALMASGVARAIFSTNFDNTLERAEAIVAGNVLQAYSLEGSHAAVAALNAEEYPLYVKLHGDFRYDKLKNLSADLQSQDAELGKCLVAAANRFGFIVVGYSGRDESVMKLLRDACEVPNAFPYGLYWLTLKNSKPLPAVVELLGFAHAKGITSELIEIETFDSVLSRLWRQLPTRDAALNAKVTRAASREVAIPLPPGGTKKPILRMNALPIVKLPSECLEISFASAKDWEELRDAGNKAGDELAFTKDGGVYAWAKKQTIRDTFQDVRSVVPIDISNKLGNLPENLFILSMLERAVALALKRGKPLLYRTTRGRSYLIVDKHAEDQSTFTDLSKIVDKVHGTAPGLFTTPTERYPEKQRIEWAEAAEISIEERDGRYWLLILPTVWIWPKHGRRDATKLLDELAGKRFNEKADKILSAWLSILLPSDGRNANISLRPFDDGTDAENPEFVVNNRTAFSVGLS